MRRLIFENVGRDKWNGSIYIPDTSTADQIAEFAYEESKKHLASRFPDVEYDTQLNKGIIEAGCRTVGIFHVE